MKRSEINGAIAWAKDLLHRNNIHLPAMAYWNMDEWKANAGKLDTVRKVMLGWDITDFGTNDFSSVGAVLYTVRNGLMDDPGVGVPFCEKYIVMRDGQRLTNHYHVAKTEDIINRAGGVMSMYFYNRLPDGTVDRDSPVTLSSDGLFFTVEPGQEVLVTPGNSVRITPFVYHVFGAKQGEGDLVVGEVSAINDDNTDNYWATEMERFAAIEEDEAPLHPLCNEYDRL